MTTDHTSREDTGADANESTEQESTSSWVEDSVGIDKDRTPSTAPEANTPSGNSITLEEVRKTVYNQLDQRTWKVMEAVMSAHMTLCIDGIESCFGLIIQGRTGSGKTTVLGTFRDLPNFYSTDDVTPASFVSADASRSEEELDDDDLLPRIQHQTVLNPEMANWFAGDWETRSAKWARLVRVMDGEGYTRDSGTHGQRSHTGDYRFNFIGATTELESEDWEMMGHTGNRFLFHEMPATTGEDEAREAVFGGDEYGKDMRIVRNAIHSFLRTQWAQHGGYRGVKWSGRPDEDIEDQIYYLSNLIRHARAPIVEEDNDQNARYEDPKRVLSMTYDLARGHSLLCGRREITQEDLRICARVALSTMPWRRRTIIREVLSLDLGEELTRREVQQRQGISKPTAISRMNLAETLGIGEIYETPTQGGSTLTIAVNPDFVWPTEIKFPEF